MEYICKQSTIVRGDLVRAGKKVSISDGELSPELLARAFEPVVEQAEKDDGLVCGLTREQAVIKLRQAGVRCSNRMSLDDIRSRFEDTFSSDSQVM